MRLDTFREEDVSEDLSFLTPVEVRDTYAIECDNEENWKYIGQVVRKFDDLSLNIQPISGEKRFVDFPVYTGYSFVSNKDLSQLDNIFGPATRGMN